VKALLGVESPLGSFGISIPTLHVVVGRYTSNRLVLFAATIFGGINVGGRFFQAIVGLMLALASAAATAGPLDPDCTVKKAAKSTAMKATVGVGGRCDAKEAAADTAKGSVGIDDTMGSDNKKRDKNANNKEKDDDKGLIGIATRKVLNN